MKKIATTLLGLVTAIAAQASPYSTALLETLGIKAPVNAVDNTAEIHQDVMLAFGNMDQWFTRSIKESKLLGGKTVTLSEVAPNGSTTGNKPYVNMGGSPWATSNVYAKLAGIVKTNVSVYKDAHPGHGSCAKLYSHLVSCKVLGVVDVEVFAAGSLYLGTMEEPITGASNPYGKINFGVKFNKKPKAVKFDYKTKIVSGNRIKKGTGMKSTVQGQDMAECVCFIQKRWEDASGNIFATRIGTLVKRFNKSTSDWVNDAEFEIHYGDMTGVSGYDKASMGLSGNGGVDRCAKNSKGKLVKITEVGWDANATPTHMILQFSSSHGGAYIGTVGNTLWVDNVRMVY